MNHADWLHATCTLFGSILRQRVQGLLAAMKKRTLFFRFLSRIALCCTILTHTHSSTFSLILASFKAFVWKVASILVLADHPSFPPHFILNITKGHDIDSNYSQFVQQLRNRNLSQEEEKQNQSQSSSLTMTPSNTPHMMDSNPQTSSEQLEKVRLNTVCFHFVCRVLLSLTRVCMLFLWFAVAHS